ncbi:response regulator [Methanogenium organophilum]|uniref:Response regulator n=1 Tax=Methanogenium organophilum TaxID=2199 RepID=A0A9X9S493_METOG|nr:response regulator [Methanogenium organophilum]WAI01709.1 response regulator [Methanogenium organophilum]
MYVLIVEDSRTQAEVLRDMLKKHGYEAVIAKDGKRALELVRVRNPSLIISDVIMPVMDGYELCSTLKNDPGLRDIPCILLTALYDTRDVARALQAGADNFITKPYPEEYLIGRVNTILSAPKRRSNTDNNLKSIPFSHDGEKYHLPADHMKVFDFLLSAYEAAIMQHNELQRAQKSLHHSNENLNTLNQIISIGNHADDPDATISLLLEKTVNLLGYRMGGIFLRKDDDRDSADLRYTYGITLEDRAIIETSGPIDFRNQHIRAALTRGDPLFLSSDSDGDDLGGVIIQRPEIENCAILPMVSNGGVIGVITLLNGKKHPTLGDEKSFLSTVCSEIGTVVEKVLLLKRLEIANEETNLYLDIMTHDINNANAAALGYLEILSEELEGKEKTYAENSLSSVNQSIDIIANVSTIRMMRERTTALQPVRLDDVIRMEMERYENVRFTYSGTDEVVLADDLIGQIFMNLIGNSAKFAAPHPEITIAVERVGQDVFVCVADNGPGIPDEMKSLIFDRFCKGRSRRSGKGLGLFITHKLVEEYGGSIQAEDRVPGVPEEGAAIRFNLLSV